MIHTIARASCSLQTDGGIPDGRDSTRLLAALSVKIPPIGVPSTPANATHSPKRKDASTSLSSKPSAIMKFGPNEDTPITVAVKAAYPSTSSRKLGIVRMCLSCCMRGMDSDCDIPSSGHSMAFAIELSVGVGDSGRLPSTTIGAIRITDGNGCSRPAAAEEQAGPSLAGSHSGDACSDDCCDERQSARSAWLTVPTGGVTTPGVTAPPGSCPSSFVSFVTVSMLSERVAAGGSLADSSANGSMRMASMRKARPHPGPSAMTEP
mmetsp:Transcript_23041/g.52288  ORF Transcript_23041/g.52288 Transcript_23041/m.52288 type:complete len:264 (+) Transcript_23041:602-1393(+)